MKRAREDDPPRRLRVAILGDAFVDVQVGGVDALPRWGADVSCSSVKLMPGGSAGNTARQLGGLALAEMEASFFSCVGGDEAGAHYVQTLEAEGVLASPRQTLHVLADAPQSCCVILSGPADRAMCSCYETVHRVRVELFAEALAGDASASSDSSSSSAAPWSLVHIGGYFNCIGLHSEALLQLVKALRARGALVSLDPQHDCSGKWSGEGGHLSSLLPLLDIFMPNEVEIVKITGAPTPEAALDQLSAAHPELLVVMTLGASGLRAARGGRRWTTGAMRVARFVDATGAGDAAGAGFLVQYLRDKSDVELALRWAAAAGALCVSQSGACSAPLRSAQVAAALAAGEVA